MTHPTQKDFEDARRLLNDPDLAWEDWVTEHSDATIFALRFTAKMMGEPSEGMVEAYFNFKSPGGLTPEQETAKEWMAMRDQAIKEIEDENQPPKDEVE